MDEARLLEFMEGQLAESESAELRRQIEDDPALQAWVSRVREDRAVLQALEDPALPRDFLAELEPMLARPMLVDDGPMAVFQRRHQRRRRAQQVTMWSRRLAMAASVVLVAGAGVWAFVQFSGGNGNGAGTVAEAPAVTPELLPQAGDTDQAPAADALVHHYGPPADVRIATAESAAGSQANGVDLPRGIALVIHTDDVNAMEAVLAGAMTPFSDRGALVRNFSFEEALALDRQLHGGGGNVGGVDDAVTASTSVRRAGARNTAELHRLAEQIRRERPAGSTASGAAQDEIIVGERSRMPGYEQQLEYSSIGATYSVVIPGDAVNDLLRFLVVDRGVEAQLITMPDEPSATAMQPDRWLKDREPVARWLRAHQSGGVQVPVIVVAE